MQMTLENVSRKLAEMGITDVEEQAGVFAQIKAESGFQPRSESLNYSPERLQKTFPKYFKTVKEAEEALTKGQEHVANIVYGNRMGNAADEGFKYRGRGLIQLTGKNNYERYGDKIGVDLVNNPDLANDPEVAFELAVAYLLENSPNLKDPVATTKAVGPARLEEKTAQRAELQKEYEERLREMQPVEPVEVSEPEQAEDTYTVKPGDTLYRIAAERGLNAEEIMQANGILDATKIQPGQVISMPLAESEQEEGGLFDTLEAGYDYAKSQVLDMFK